LNVLDSYLLGLLYRRREPAVVEAVAVVCFDHELLRSELREQQKALELLSRQKKPEEIKSLKHEWQEQGIEHSILLQQL